MSFDDRLIFDLRPRLGPILHRVVCVGGLYFIMGSLEAILRIYKVLKYFTIQFFNDSFAFSLRTIQRIRP